MCYIHVYQENQNWIKQIAKICRLIILIIKIKAEKKQIKCITWMTFAGVVSNCCYSGNCPLCYLSSAALCDLHGWLLRTHFKRLNLK